jgi:hypothetical protein
LRKLVVDEAMDHRTEEPKHSRRLAFAIFLTVALHGGLLAAAFAVRAVRAVRAPEQKPQATTVVRVLTGQVDEMGEFQASGLRDARIAVR